MSGPPAVATMLMELRAERNRIAERLEAIDQALAGLTALGRLEGVAPFTPLTVVGNPTARRIDPAVLARAKRLYEVDALEPSAIAQRCGITKQAVQYHAKRWKKPAQAAERLAGKVRCPACSEWTETDPCEACHKKVRSP